MRIPATILSLFLLAFPAAAELVPVARVGGAVGMAPAPGRAGLIVLTRAGRNCELRSVDLTGRIRTRVPVEGTPLAICGATDGVFVCVIRNNVVEVQAWGPNRRTWRLRQRWTVGRNRLTQPQILYFHSSPTGLRLVAQQGTLLHFWHVGSDGRAREDHFAREGCPDGCIAAITTSRDRTDFILYDPRGRVARYRPEGSSYKRIQRYSLSKEQGFKGTCAVGDTDVIYLAGAAGNRAAIARLDPNARGAVNKLKDLFKDPGETPRRVDAVTRHNAGTYRCVDTFDARHLVVGGRVQGARQNGAWVGLVRRSGRMNVVHGLHVGGVEVVDVVVNPRRRGWTFAARTRNGTVHLVRLNSDPQDRLPPIQDPPPVRPDPCGCGCACACGDGDGWIDGGGGELEGGRRDEKTLAIFPTAGVAAATNGQVCELLVVYLGKRRVTIQVAFVDKDGRVASRQTLRPNRRGQRWRIRVPKLIRGRPFDGYLAVSGANQETLVAEVICTSTRWQNTTGILRPHWR